MSTLLAAAQSVQAPKIDYKELSPLFALAGGSVIVLMVGLLSSRFVRSVVVPALTAVSLLTAIGLTIWIWEPGNHDPILQGALGVDALSLGLSMLFYVAGLVTIVLSLRSTAGPTRPCMVPWKSRIMYTAANTTPALATSP